jgi:hypothetical protein
LLNWKKAATCAATVMVGLLLASAPAAAATYPTSNFGPDTYRGPAAYGATWARGTMTWYDRGVHVKGELRTVSSGGCRRVVVFTLDQDGYIYDDGARSSSVKCGDAVHPVEFTVPANVNGGAAYVRVCIDDKVDDKTSLVCSYDYPRP